MSSLSRFVAPLAAVVLGCGFAAPALAVQINFTGGAAVLGDGSVQTTNNSNVFSNVDYYDEGGFRLDFIGATSAAAGFIGDYYGAGNDVIHGHWATGHYGELTQIRVTKLDGDSFDLNYFVLTSNTDTGGGRASGNEKVLIHASVDGVTSSFAYQLPSEDWGFPATQIFLGPEFDDIKAFWFTAENIVDCFGMDNFYINEPAPVSEPGTLALLGLGLGALFKRRRVG